MSLPQELLDQLLSGYLDDNLSADERQSVERLLRTDPSLGEQLGQLREMRQSLRLLAQVDSVAKLDQGFADRVLGAAVAKAQEAGLADDHPLIRLAEQRSTSPAPVSGRKFKPWWKAAAVVAGLAASIGFAVMVLRPSNNELSNNKLSSNATSSNATSDLVAHDRIETPPSNPLEPRVEPDPAAELGGEREVPGPMLANAPPGSVNVSPTQPKPPSESIAVAAEGPQSQVDSPAADRSMLGVAMMVLEVRRTEAGRNLDAVAKAMRAAEMTPASRKEVTEQVAGLVADTLEAQQQASDDVKVLYLQVPARQFDVFYRVLWADQEGVESIRLSVASDAPLMQIVDEVQRDPKSVRHEPAAYELFSRDGAVDKLIRELNQLPFVATDRNRAPTGFFGSGPDFTAQVLVLVR